MSSVEPCLFYDAPVCRHALRLVLLHSGQQEQRRAGTHLWCFKQLVTFEQTVVTSPAGEQPAQEQKTTEARKQEDYRCKTGTNPSSVNPIHLNGINFPLSLSLTLIGYRIFCKLTFGQIYRRTDLRRDKCKLLLLNPRNEPSNYVSTWRVGLELGLG